MGSRAERSPAEWYAEAARWYIEGHQGCPYCGGRHCVLRSDRGRRIEYICSVCEFSACRDRESGQHYAAEGEKKVAAPLAGRGLRPVGSH